MADDLFQADPSVIAAAPVEAKFEDYVGEGKRYATNDDAAKALVEKDRFIEQLKRENAEAREAANKRINEEEFLTKLERLTAQRSPETPPQEVERDAVTAVTPEDVKRIWAEEEAGKARQNNLNEVQGKLSQVFGPEWKVRVQAKAQELGVSTNWLTEVAAKSPKAFYVTLGITETRTEPKTDIAPPRSSVNMQADAPHAGAKDYAYWADMRKKNGEGWYFSTATQQQIWKEVKSQGEAKFYSRSA